MVDVRPKTLVLIFVSLCYITLTTYFFAAGLELRKDPLRGYDMRTCVVKSTLVESDKDGSGNVESQSSHGIGVGDEAEYRGVVSVLVVGGDGGLVNASRYGDLDGEWEKEYRDVREYVERFKVGGEHRCWALEGGDGGVVKMSRERKPDGFWGIRIGGFASGIVLGLLVMVWVLRKEVVGEGVRGWVERLFGDRGVFRLGFVGVEVEGRDVKEAIRGLEVGVGGEGLDRKKWVCSICLEGSVGPQGGFDESVVDLPCGNQHFVHAGCVFKWLSKGGSTCPLCGFKISPYIAQSASQSSSERDLKSLRRFSRSTGSLRLLRARWDRESRQVVRVDEEQQARVDIEAASENIGGHEDIEPIQNTQVNSDTPASHDTQGDNTDVRIAFDP